MAAAIHQVVGDTIHYDPTVREKALAAKSAASEVATLETFTVTESNEAPGFRAYRDQKRREAQAAKPSLAGGASRQIRPNITAGVSPYVDILPFGDSRPRWTLLNVRF